MGLVNFEFYQDIIVISLTGEISGYGSDILLEEFEKFFKGKENSRIVVDFSGALLIDSTGISALLSLRRNRNSKIPIRVCSMNSNIRNIFDQIHLSKLFDFFPDLELAIKYQWREPS